MVKYLTNIDLNKNSLNNVVIQPLTTAPSNPKEGQIYYNSNDKHYYRYNGTSWIAYQNKITTNGILKGDGNGNISAASTEEVSTLNVDSAPTSGSNNLITSGGVYTALQNSTSSIEATLYDWTT